MKGMRVGAALAGRRLWLRIKKKYDVDDGVYVILMPEDDQTLNEPALLHIDDLIAHRGARGVVLLTGSDWVLRHAGAYSSGIIDAVPCSEKQMDGLLKFCELYRFSERLLTVSLHRPYGNKAWRAVGVQGVTVEELVCIGMFCIRNWTEPKADG